MIQYSSCILCAGVRGRRAPTSTRRHRRAPHHTKMSTEAATQMHCVPCEVDVEEIMTWPAVIAAREATHISWNERAAAASLEIMTRTGCTEDQVACALSSALCHFHHVERGIAHEMFERFAPEVVAKWATVAAYVDYMRINHEELARAARQQIMDEAQVSESIARLVLESVVAHEIP